MTARPGPRARGQSIALIAAAVVSGVTSGLLVTNAVRVVRGRQTALWILGRASGITAYVLLVLVVVAGLMLSHPWRTRLSRPPPDSRIRVHIVIAVLALVLVVVHVGVLVSDKYAGVGLAGAFLPMRATYRPVSVTFGVVGAWLGLVVGLTAALAGRLPTRAWWALHKVAGVVLVLCWAHAVLAGSDTVALGWFYLGTAALVGTIALSRYTARSPNDRLAAAGR